MPCVNGVVIGIFSREDPTSYEWLIHEVMSASWVQHVRPVIITNTWCHFDERVSECSFAILYHSKRRGRLNVTDVTDCLYDAELEHLSRVLGKKKVIVVMDHLEDRSEEMKTQILENQPRIGRLASELLLVNGERTKRQEIKNLRSLIKNPTRRNRISKLFILLILFFFVLVIIILIVKLAMLPGAEIVTSSWEYSTVTPITTTNSTFNSSGYILSNTTATASNTTV
ncbi:uncharacterized protein [Phyllobates terribilis]|uniref:uncharacterized protein n=1 Tax=Phyllobates terribilis TaxID=111132 RepID=UPI003CCB49C6